MINFIQFLIIMLNYLMALLSIIFLMWFFQSILAITKKIGCNNISKQKEILKKIWKYRINNDSLLLNLTTMWYDYKSIGKIRQASLKYNHANIFEGKCDIKHGERQTIIQNKNKLINKESDYLKLL